MAGPGRPAAGGRGRGERSYTQGGRWQSDPASPRGRAADRPPPGGLAAKSR